MLKTLSLTAEVALAAISVYVWPSAPVSFAVASLVLVGLVGFVSEVEVFVTSGLVSEESAISEIVDMREECVAFGPFSWRVSKGVACTSAGNICLMCGGQENKARGECPHIEPLGPLDMEARISLGNSLDFTFDHIVLQCGSWGELIMKVSVVKEETSCLLIYALSMCALCSC